jgi:Kef-type K+ transport system membrane component KefB
VSIIAQSVIGLHFIIGTFFSGLIVYKEIIRKQNFERVYGIISAITFGFFAPIFFAIIGVNIQIELITTSLPIFAVLIGVAIFSKVGAGYVGSRILSFSKDESITIGYLMNGRGMVELVIASIGFSSGIIDLKLFSIAVVIGFITTIMAPLLSRPYVTRIKSGLIMK